MRRAKKEINYSRIVLKYMGLTVVWTAGIYGVIFLLCTAGDWFFNHINEINGWYAVLFVVFVLCCIGNILDMSDEINYLKKYED